MKRGSLLLLTCICSSAIAAPAIPTGSFGIEFSENPEAATYTVSGSGSSYKVVSVADQTDYDATVMDDAAKKTFWQQRGLKADVADASCLRFEREVICAVDDTAKKADDKLQQLKTNFFYFDPMSDNPIVTAFPVK